MITAPAGDSVDPIAAPAPRYLPAPDVAVVTSYFNSHNYASKRRGLELFRHSIGALRCAAVHRRVCIRRAGVRN